MSTHPPLRYRDAVVALRGHQKTSKGGPAYSRFVNRPIGRRLAALAYRLGRTPNQVTAVSALCTFAGIASIALVDASVPSAIGTSALLVLGYALDSADGQLARLRGGGSVAGEWLDHVVDAAKTSSIHLAVLVQWYRFGDHSEAQLLIPIAFQVVASVLFFTIILNDQIRRARRGTTEMLLERDGTSSPLYSLAVIPTDYGLLCLVFVLLWWEAGFTGVYSALLVANAAFAVLALAKWYREMRQH